MSIDIKGVSKRFGDFQALADIDLGIGAGELVALLGPSGSGKTTLLRIIAGLESADSGTVLFEGEEALKHHPRDRRVGFVFQHYALFRHMTVFDNVAFGLQVRPRSQRPPTAEIADRVHSLLKLVQLAPLADRYPSQLSGGQRQRVALARALAIEPKVLLLDEPFGALDAKVRKELRRWLRHLHEEMRITSVFVTHDQEEALELADRVVVMSHGRIEQVGTPAEVYRTPASAFVYEFLGDVNRLDCRVEAGQVLLAEGGAPLGGAVDHAGPGTLYVRPHDVELVAVDGAANGPQLGLGPVGTVRMVHEVGPLARAEVEYGGTVMDVTLPEGGPALAPGDRVRIGIRRGFVFPAQRAREEGPLPFLPFPLGDGGRRPDAPYQGPHAVEFR